MPHLEITASISRNISLNESYYLIEVLLSKKDRGLWQPKAGMFVQIQSKAPDTILRRPISIAYYKKVEGKVGFLIQDVGKATSFWRTLAEGSAFNFIGPLGNGFTLTKEFSGERPLLVAGGVGIAPILMLSQEFSKRNITPTILYGAKTDKIVVFLKELSQFGNLYIATEDGSLGNKGFVTTLPQWHSTYSSIYTCGPRKMMEAVIKQAREKNTPCEVSLENRMACGIGACLCCVEKTTEGHICVCTEGPVFNEKKLLID